MPSELRPEAQVRNVNDQINRGYVLKSLLFGVTCFKFRTVEGPVPPR